MHLLPPDAFVPLILASASPRRSALLQDAGIAFERCPAAIDESRLPEEAPDDYVTRLARAKARAAWREGTRSLGADTVVVLESDVLGKPRDASEAERMLASLSGRSHCVLTGVALFDGATAETWCEVTEVQFRKLTATEIASYVATGEPMDKAGAYAIQGGAAKFVERIDGSYSNVVGLPIEAVKSMLR